MQASTSAAEASRVIAWLRDYAEERINSRLMDERRSISPHIVLDFGNRGVLSMLAPKRYGGLELDNASVSRVLQQLAAIDLNLGTFVTVNNSLGIRPILRHATPVRQEELLPRLGSGRELAAFAMTEPEAGANIARITSEARPDGNGGWTLWGTKYWSGTSGWAGAITTFVQLEGPAGRAVTGFLVRAGSRGLRIGPEALTMGMRGMVQNEVRLEGVRVSADDLMGAPGEGMAVALDTIEYGRFALCSLAVGVTKRCLQLMVRQAGRRSIATGRLLANPIILTRISELTAAAQALEALVQLVADSFDAGETLPSEIYRSCKAAGGEIAWRAADHLVQQLGGRGYIESNIAPQILRDARIMRVFEGPTEAMYMHIGSRLIHDADEITRCIAEKLGQPALATELRTAAGRIAERAFSSRSPMPDRKTAQDWACANAGEVGVQAILLAAVKSRQQRAPGGAWRRAEDWARQAFDQKLAAALSISPAEAVLQGSKDIEEWVAGFAADIGDIEQNLPGEDRELDPLLKREWKPEPAACAAKPNGTACQNSAAAPIPEAAPKIAVVPEHVDAGTAWLINWIGQEYRRDPATMSASDRLSGFGIDSVTALKLSNDLSSWLKVEVSSTLAWDYPTIGATAEYLASIPGAVFAGNPGGAAPAGGNGLARDALAALANFDQLSDEQIGEMLAESEKGS